MLRLLQGHNFRNISFNRLARLGSVYFARDNAIMEVGVFRAKLQMTTLEPAAGLTDADLQPPASLPAYVDVSDQADFLAAHPIKQPPLSYSADAARRRVQGCVILNLYVSRAKGTYGMRRWSQLPMTRGFCLPWTMSGDGDLRRLW